MKYFIDFEFIDTGKKIEFISIGIIDENNRTYYAVNKNCNFHLADEWIKENVIKNLFNKYHTKEDCFKNKKDILNDILKFFYIKKVDFFNYRFNWLSQLSLPIIIKFFPFLINLCFEKKTRYIYEGEKIEFWGDYCEYDYVVFCQLFGKMIDLPKGFPCHFNDIKDLSEFLGDVDYSLENTASNHNALDDARLIKKQYEFLTSF